MSEQFAFEQGIVQDGTVQRDEWAGSARIGGMDGVGHQLLARSRLPLDQDRRAQRPDLLDQFEDLTKLRTLGHHLVELVALARLLAELLQLVDQLATIQDSLDEEPELFGIVGLGDEIVGPGFHGPQRLGRLAERRQHDHPDREPSRRARG